MGKPLSHLSEEKHINVGSFRFNDQALTGKKSGCTAKNSTIRSLISIPLFRDTEVISVRNWFQLLEKTSFQVLSS